MEAKSTSDVALDGDDPHPGSRRQTDFASLVILDLESTGLKDTRPKITELCMLSVQTDELKSGAYPRVVNKLQLCFNPQKLICIEASQLTGLYNDALEQMSLFKDQVSVVSSFLDSQPQPVCIIAHNGLYFDFPLLQAELCKANCTLSDGMDIWCADSLHALRVLDGLPAEPNLYIKRQTSQGQAADNGNNSEKCDSTSAGGEDKESAPTKRAAGLGEDSSASKLVKKDSSELTPAEDLKQSSDTDEPAGDQVKEKEAAPSFRYRKRRSRMFVKRERLAQRLALANQGGGATAEDTSVTSATLEGQSVGVLSSQGSIPDAEIAKAFDDIMAQTEADFSDTAKGGSMQKGNETTPNKEEKQTPDTVANVADQFVKKKPESVAEARAQARFSSKRDRLAKRLFGGKAGDSSESKPFILPPAHTSYKLSEIYKRDNGKYPDVSHTAEDDCITLLKVIVKRQARFMSYVEDNAVLLSSVEPMHSGSPTASNSGSD